MDFDRCSLIFLAGDFYFATPMIGPFTDADESERVGLGKLLFRNSLTIIFHRQFNSIVPYHETNGYIRSLRMARNVC